MLTKADRDAKAAHQKWLESKGLLLKQIRKKEPYRVPFVNYQTQSNAPLSNSIPTWFPGSRWFKP